MKLLSVILKHSKVKLLVAALLGAASGAASAGLLATVHKGIEAQVPWTDPKLVLGFVALCLLAPLLSVSSRNLLVTVAQQAILELRLDLSRRILKAPLRRLEDVGAPRLLAALTRDTNTIGGVISDVPGICINLAMVAGALSYLAFLSWKVFLGMLVLIVLAVIGYQIPIARAQKIQRQAREKIDELFEHFESLTRGTKELLMHVPRRRSFLKQIERSSEDFRDSRMKAIKTYNMTDGWGQLLIFTAIGVLVFVAPRFEVLGTTTLVGYALALFFLVGPIEGLMNDVPNLADGSVAVKKVEQLGVSLVDGESRGELAARPISESPWKRLDLVGVTYEYPSKEGVEAFRIGPVDLELTAGELVFLIGGNGCGKTTLAKVLLGLYEPTSGEIRVDGVAVTDENRDRYRSFFSSVFSDSFLFKELFGLESPDADAQAAHYLEKLQLAEKVQVENGRFNTIDVSQGQRKRLALLVAYLEDRPVYLFDEWAADQDPFFRQFFYHELLPELKARGKTVLVISHDDRYYDMADRIVKLEYGTVAEDVKSLPASPQKAIAS